MTFTSSPKFFLLFRPGTFLALLIFLSIAGNILVCVAIYTERSLRRIGNLFLASLAIADLFVASLVMTFAGVNDILGEKFVNFFFVLGISWVVSRKFQTLNVIDKMKYIVVIKNIISSFDVVKTTNGWKNNWFGGEVLIYQIN